MRLRIVNWLWPIIEPYVAALVAEIVAQALEDVKRRERSRGVNFTPGE